MKQALPILLFMLLIFISVIGFVTYYIQDSLAPIDNKAATEWWNNGWSYRVAFEVDSGNYVRTNKPVSFNLNLTSALNTINKSGNIDTDSFRVVEVDSNGQVVNPEVPFQFDKTSNFNSSTNATGELVWILQNETQKNTKRNFHLYFDFENKSIPSANITPIVKATDNVTYKEYASIRIETPNGEYYYHKTGGGFATMIDKDSKDWISWNKSTGANGDFRGVPNMVHPNDGGYFHPGRDTVQTELLNSGPIRTSFRSFVGAEWEVIWDVYPEYASMRVIKAPSTKNYWFLYEGTPGGLLELDKDKLTKSDGTSIFASQEWTTDLSGEEWIYVSDGLINRSLFLAHHQDDQHVDGYVDMDTMTVFGFGRSKNTRNLSGLNNSFTFGFLDSKDFEAVKTKVNSSYKEIVVTKGVTEFNNDQTSVTPPNNSVIPTTTVTPSITPTIDLIQPTITPSLTPTISISLSQIPSPTTSIPSGNICGKADVNGDGVFTIADFAEFARAYGRGTNSCADKDVDYGPCGGRDVTMDGKLNIADFGAAGVGFAQRYYPKTSCAIN
ncbi:MAG TPA: hypothetical protein PKU78_02740 [Candidatus Dojkabacteria bacterium]|nr:hypothetical protein [Candidatus Dojkabacteria bacterium]